MAAKRGNPTERKQVRDTRTGQWVPPEEAKKRPATTVTETIKPTKKKPK